MNQEPLDRTVGIGDTPILDCAFNYYVSCIWEKDDCIVEVDGRYHYLTLENGSDTTNCSIEIRSLRPSDLGKWKCSHKKHDRAIEVVSKSVSLMGKSSALNE